jgi:sortase (surface protein transpeptidase)
VTAADPADRRENNGLRRLLSAGPVLVPGVAAVALLVAAVLSGGSGHHDGDPPVSRTLPGRAFAPEWPHEARASQRSLVDVVDRDAARPQRIRIPAIGVWARVIPLRLEPDGTMQTPDDVAETGWYAPGREPGERGPAVVVGHVDDASGPGVFYRLRELRRGDWIRIARADGSVVRFRVEGLERWPKAAFPTRRVFGDTHTATLRLVTCSGNFDASTGHYVDNTIVYAARPRVRQPRREQ